MRERLEEQKKAIVETGHDAADLTLERQAKELTHLQEDISKTAQDLAIPPPSFSAPGNSISGIEDSLSSISESIRSLERSNLKTLADTNSTMLQIDNGKKQFTSFQKDLDALGDVSVESLAAREGVVGERLRSAQIALSSAQAKVSNLAPLLIRAEGMDGELMELRVNIETLVREHGEEKSQREALERTKKAIEEARNQKFAFARHEQLVTLAADYISEVHPANCPVCAQSISHLDLVTRNERDDPSGSGRFT
jgi:DNA repair exonuclease SbcCD ATPase subunit